MKPHLLEGEPSRPAAMSGRGSSPAIADGNTAFSLWPRVGFRMPTRSRFGAPQVFGSIEVDTPGRSLGPGSRSCLVQ
jgi:hypothetical protein